ncbi:MAG: aminotransferase, partial [Massilia sp.]|nr:aminotransferase [Massilia sp.]
MGFFAVQQLAAYFKYINRTDQVRPILKSTKLDDVCYEIRGPAMEKARQMEEDGHKIIKLN